MPRRTPRRARLPPASVLRRDGRLRMTKLPLEIEDLLPEAVAWRHDFHRHPELLFDVHRTAQIVTDRLRQFGCDEVVTGIGRTGVVAAIAGGRAAAGRVIGLRADMDALPIQEATGLPHASIVPGQMHACGHDGHTAMLLAAAKHLAGTRHFDGTAILIFQPAEEGGGGARLMIEDGLLDRFGVQEVYGLHNMSGIPVGRFALRSGPIMAASDRFEIVVHGIGGHAARPHAGIDPILVAGQLIVALQSIVARNIDPLESAVVSLGAVRGGETHNVIPQCVELRGTVRGLTEDVRKQCQKRLETIAGGVGDAFGAEISVAYHCGYPVTTNHAKETLLAVQVAADVAGGGVDTTIAPLMLAEDFGYMLQQRPGAYILLGNGGTKPLHHPGYDFNDAAIAYGISFWARLVEMRMPVPT
jgi:amidohydrolase